MIPVGYVIKIHDEILSKEKGMDGIASLEKLEGCLGRIENQMVYEPFDDVFTVAAFIAVSIAKAHAFNDGNKRTALVVALTYLEIQGIRLQAESGLDDLMVQAASSEIDYSVLADSFAALAE